ncbi:MAG: WhiB family transcriptional regulator [Actinomycetes bacterium]|jgi:WhiB family redox-sensing transcriptional regulator
MTPADLSIVSWREAAACRSRPEVDFFPSREDSTSIARAKAVCAGCPVREPCLEWALVTGQPDGIWGGHTPRERRAMRRMLVEAAV